MTHAGYSGRYVHKTPRAQNSTSMEFIQMSFDIFNFKLLCAFQEGEDKAVKVSAPLAKRRLFQTVEGVSLKSIIICSK